MIFFSDFINLRHEVAFQCTVSTRRSENPDFRVFYNAALHWSVHSQLLTRWGRRLRSNFGMGKCRFNPLWLSDSKYDWVQAVPGNEWEAQCSLCRKKFKLGTMGHMALESHMKSAKHLVCSAATKGRHPYPSSARQTRQTPRLPAAPSPHSQVTYELFVARRQH